MSYLGARKWLAVRGIRKRVTLDDCDANALADLDLPHLRAMAKAARRLSRHTETSVVTAVFPILSRNPELPKRLASLHGQDVRPAADEILSLHVAATTDAERDGSIESLTSSLYDQFASLLSAKLPFGCTLVRGVCIGELKRALVKGWSPQAAGSIFVRRFLADPKHYVLVAPLDLSSFGRSAAPYRTSRSEMRG